MIKSMFEISRIHSRGGFSLLLKSFAPLRNETNRRALVPFPWWLVAPLPKVIQNHQQDRGQSNPRRSSLIDVLHTNFTLW